MFRLRPIRLEDVAALCSLQHGARHSNDEAVRPADLHRLLTRQGRGWLVECQGQLCGYALVRRADGSLHQLYVRPEWQNQGVGSRLINRASRFLRRCGHRQMQLATSSAWPAQRFYCRQGWRVARSQGTHQVLVRPLR